MTEVTALLSPTGDSNILAVQAFKGLHLEPPTKDVVSFVSTKILIYKIGCILNKKVFEPQNNKTNYVCFCSSKLHRIQLKIKFITIACSDCIYIFILLL